MIWRDGSAPSLRSGSWRREGLPLGPDGCRQLALCAESLAHLGSTVLAGQRRAMSAIRLVKTRREARGFFRYRRWDLFSRRDSSPRRPGRWLNQQLGHQLVQLVCELGWGVKTAALSLSLRSAPLRSRAVGGWFFIFRALIFFLAEEAETPSCSDLWTPDVK